MRLEFEPSVSSQQFAETAAVDNIVDLPYHNAETLVRQGVAAAQSGDRANARVLLLEATEADSRNADAWLWLASISEYPEELLVFLHNVLDIDPANERARTWEAATRSLLAKTFVQRGITAHDENQSVFAMQCFDKAIEHDENCEMAWFWRASMLEFESDKVECLERVLTIDPTNDDARFALKSIADSRLHAKFADAKSAAVAGDLEKAVHLVDELLEFDLSNLEAWTLRSHISKSLEEKILSYDRMIEIDPENVFANAGRDFLNGMVESVRPALPFPEAESEPLESERMEAQEEEFVCAKNESAEAVEYKTETVGFAQPWDEDQNEIADEAQIVIEEGSSEHSDVSGNVDSLNRELQLMIAANREMDDNLRADSENMSMRGDEDTAFDESAPDDETILFAFNSEENVETEFSYADDTDVVVENQKLEREGNEYPDAAHLSEGNEVEDQFQASDNDADQHSDQSPWHSLAKLVDYDDREPETSDEKTFGYIGPVVEVSEYFSSEQEDQIDDVSSHQTYELSNKSTESDEASTPEFPLTAAEKMCSFCGSEIEHQAFACVNCHAVLSLSDIDRLMANTAVDIDLMRQSVTRMEAEWNVRDMSGAELQTLGVGMLNLKHYDRGLGYLKEASRLNPNDVFLTGQINALAIRLDEMNPHSDAHNEIAKGCSILVVDDSPTVRKLISNKLEKSGHKVVCASDGVEAMEAIEGFVPDLVLLDITMPRMDGYQVCKLIRSREAVKDVPVVMISGKDGFFDKVRGRMAGTSGYITKPFGPETLMKALETYLMQQNGLIK